MKRFLFISIVAALCLPGCTREQLAGAGQGWQRNECAKIPDKVEYDRCMRAAEGK
jgi:hypothetical protein